MELLDASVDGGGEHMSGASATADGRRRSSSLVDALSAAANRYVVAMSAGRSGGGGGGGGGGASSSPSSSSSGSPKGPPPPDLTPEELGLQITTGGVAGFCSGYALKKASKLAALAIGLGFVTVQVLRYNGLIGEVQWALAERRFTELLDADGDGRVTPADLQVHARRAMDVLGFNVPAAAAFGAALLLGFRSG